MGSTSTVRFRRPQAGFALLAVLWGVTLLIVLALVLSNSVQVEVRTAIYRKEAARAHAIARGAVEAAILEIAYPRSADQEKSSLWTWRPGQREARISFGGGKAELQIVNETGKLDLNATGREQLIRLFEARGLASAAASQLAAAIIHWRSPVGPDEETGPLEDHYQREGIRPRHARFASLEEVLRVRGMSRDVFYGTVDVTDEGKIRSKYGVGQDLTVFSGSPQVNVNCASEAVLRSVPGVSLEMGRAIIQERRREPFRSVVEITQRSPLSLPDEALAFLSTNEVTTYTIVAVGEVAGSRVRRTVGAVLQVAAQEVPRHRVVAWYDDYFGN